MKKLNYRQSSRKLNGGRGGKQKQKQRIFIFEPRTMLLVQLIWDVQPPLSTFPFLSFVLYSPLQSLRDRLLFFFFPSLLLVAPLRLDCFICFQDISPNSKVLLVSVYPSLFISLYLGVPLSCYHSALSVFSQQVPVLHQKPFLKDYSVLLFLSEHK